MKKTIRLFILFIAIDLIIIFGFPLVNCIKEIFANHSTYVCNNKSNKTFYILNSSDFKFEIKIFENEKIIKVINLENYAEKIIKIHFDVKSKYRIDYFSPKTNKTISKILKNTNIIKSYFIVNSENKTFIEYSNSD